MGKALLAAVSGEGGLFGCWGKGPAGGTAFVGVNGEGLFGVDARGTFVGINADGGFRGVLANGTGIGSIGVEATGDGAGVAGRSETGPGVHGRSGEDRGGVFESRSIAQLQLILSFDIRVPLQGRIGDLFVHLGREASAGGGATFFLCVRENPVEWRQVQLGPVIPGGDIAP